jgi:hypothetical protein
LKTECVQFIKTVEWNAPEWYTAYAEEYLGQESNMVYPWNAHQVFLVKLWIEGTPPAEMAKYLDVPWTERGDLYYIQKLAAVLEAPSR